MGWLFMQTLGGFSGPTAYLDHQFTSDRPERRSRVLRSALVSMRTYYAAIELLRLNKPREVFAAVCLVKYNPRDREGYIFGYKDMDETMGPYESACPAAILDLLTPTDSESALQWRARCRMAAEERAGKPKLRSGQIVVFEAPMTFSDGVTLDRLEVVINPNRPRAVRFRAPGGRGLYRISCLNRRTFRVEATC